MDYNDYMDELEDEITFLKLDLDKANDTIDELESKLRDKSLEIVKIRRSYNGFTKIVQLRINELQDTIDNLG